MALTIYDIQRLKETNYEKGIVEVFIQESDLLKVLPIETIDTLSVNTRRINALPSVGFRQMGSRFTDTGLPSWEVVSDNVYDIGSEITVDKLQMKDKGPFIENPLEFATKLRVKSMTYALNNAIINGDHATDANSFEGVKVRVGNLATGQTIYAGSDGTSSTNCDIRPPTITTALAYQFLNAIEAAKYAIDGHKAEYCLTGADFIRYLKNALRVIGQYVNEPGTPTSGIGERTTSAMPEKPPHFVWDGVGYIDMGFASDQTTAIVATETVNSVTCRPAYFVRTGGDYLSMIQMFPLDISEPFMLDDGVSFRVVVEWPIGLRHVHPKFMSVLRGVRVGA